MSPRRIALVAALTLSGVFVAAFLTRTSHRCPEVRLVRLVSKTVEPLDSARGTSDWIMAGIFNVEAEREVWTASFEILSLAESGIVLAPGDIKVEIAGPDGNWMARVLPPRLQVPVLGTLIAKRRMNFTVPDETRSCRFTIGYRTLTVQERCRQNLSKWGLRRRFPKLSAWISGRLPNKEQWKECRRAVGLPRVLLEEETHRKSVEHHHSVFQIAAPTNSGTMDSL